MSRTPGFHDNVVHAGVGELGDARIGLYFFKIAEQIAAPGARLVQVAVSFDELFEFRIMSIPAASLFAIALVSAKL